MAHDKSKVKVSTRRNPDGSSTATVRVYDKETGALMSEHQGTGKTPEAAAAAGLSTMTKEYDKLADGQGGEGDYQVRGAEIELVDDKTPSLSPGRRKKKPPRRGDGPARKPGPSRGEWRNHKPWKETHKEGSPGGKEAAFNDGGFNSGRLEVLFEPVPQYFNLPGDKKITGNPDNNAMIILGRDRSGKGEVVRDRRAFEKDFSEDFSSYMGAGAIDIVVGRGAPFPVKNYAGRPFELGPIFTIRGSGTSPDDQPIPELKTENILIGENKQVAHPGYMMDSARIYLSQMSDVDKYFNIPSVRQKANKKIPSSGIVLKADRVRMVSRKDIKIMTIGGAPPEIFDSMGNEITSIGGIHLIAGSGPPNTGKQQPIPKGITLVEGINKLIDQVDKLSDLVFEFCRAQIEYNGVLATHFHHSPFWAAPTTHSPTTAPAGIKTIVDEFTRVEAGILFLKKNLGGVKLNYFNSGGSSYVNSVYNTTN